MLPNIDGTALKSPPWTSLDTVEVLEYFDGPRLVLQKSQGGQLYLAWWVDADDDTDRWVYLPLSIARLKLVLAGHMASRDALADPEDGYLIVLDESVSHEHVFQAIFTEIDSIPEDILPVSGAKLNIPMPESIARLTNV